jgi:hypothetical protein
MMNALGVVVRPVVEIAFNHAFFMSTSMRSIIGSLDEGSLNGDE